jgi:GNAT superfamily N-acetyltransferase
MPDSVVRPLLPEEAEQLATLAREIWHHHYPGIITTEQIDYMLDQRYAPIQICMQLNSPDHGWWVTELNRTLVGFAHASLIGDDCKLDKLYVHPDHQRHGLGAALLKQVSRWAKAHRKPRLILQVNRHNALALNAYRKYGFTITESRVCDIGGGFVMDDHFMELKLE